MVLLKVSTLQYILGNIILNKNQDLTFIKKKKKIKSTIPDKKKNQTLHS